MIFYTSPYSAVLGLIDQGILGSFDSPNSKSKSYRRAAWCADNGCFSGQYVGDEEYLHWLGKARDDAERCAFATAPDVLCDAQATMERSVPMFPRIRALGFPAALVAQNGLENMKVPWNDLDVLFIGGDTNWKLGIQAAMLSREAVLRGKRVHMGRVNGIGRLRHAKAIGCSSADGNMLAHGMSKLPRLLSWLDDVNGQGGKICTVCGDRFYPAKLSAKACGARCRKRLSRSVSEKKKFPDYEL